MDPQRLELSRPPSEYTPAELDAAVELVARLDCDRFVLGPPLPRRPARDPDEA